MKINKTHKKESGFVLVIVLWMVAFLGFSFVIVSQWIERSLLRAQENKENISAKIALFEAEQKVIFMLATASPLNNGMQILNKEQKENYRNRTVFDGTSAEKDAIIFKIDSSPYRIDKSILKVQEARGLININFIDKASLNGILNLYGIEEERRRSLIDKLKDYIDIDDARLLNGAEADAYNRPGQVLPRNAPLQTPWQVKRVLGWGEEAVLWRGRAQETAGQEDSRAIEIRPLTELITTSLSIGFNLNTAPDEVIKVFFNKENIIEKVLKIKSFREFTNSDLSVLENSSDAFVGISKYVLFPFNSFRVILSDTRVPFERWINIQLTPSEANPWRIDYRFDRAPKSQNVQKDLQQAPLFPETPLLLSSP
jgi:Type II secretion system (T2SS), protein K